MHNHSGHNDQQPKGGRFYWPLIAFASAIGFLLFYEHRAHIPGDAVFLVGFLLLCGVMHLFMHAGHGGHGGHGDDAPTSRTESDDDWEARQ
ncbi:MAG TPA: hypothetical protein DHV57_15385 [Hyphomonas sp.]|jgi:hypothetical protein|uniref:DUF2933 domain-containing protein n=1 Tax=uncultured Hyphomonas sp. TaxID=225298 RepID=UPI000C3577AD|nr:hypothetical protein [Hyphomonadaceae bacterium]HBL93790.1 hypothetical protein [Hyphomonas sp.]HCJ18790.1 hypothetical protein [Hyphomonas sp.]|tara:strand:- start:42084 stop:42356 length:273 start_codon:yes stop_codon:yes gene_type:complete